MRAYKASSEEALRAHHLLKDWAGEKFISKEQCERMELDTICDLRSTNIFLRLVLFLFTLVIVGAAAGLFFLFVPHLESQTTGIFLLVFAALSYAAAEFAVSQARLYLHGIEEALAACSAGFLCLGMALLLSGRTRTGMEFLVPAAGAIVSLWIWHRFGFPYAPLAAMVCVIWLPGHWTSSHPAQHLIVAGLYTAGLVTVAALRPRHRFTVLESEYSIAEAFLWLGIYLAINLKLPSVNFLWKAWGGAADTSEFSRPFYWATWALIWCLPPVILARGLRRKDRFVIAAGALAAILTLVTNKPYLGWERHTWDPMIMGALLVGVALFTRRWLASGPDEIRYGFTARRLSGRDKLWINAGATAIGLQAPDIVTAPRQTGSSEVRFGGGDSGGGGATSDF